MHNRDLIVEFWCRAVSHGAAAMRLAEVVEKENDGENTAVVDKIIFNGGYSPSIHLLCAYNLELSLKTAFMLHGGSRDALKKIGHDLPEAHRAARQMGFVPRAAKIELVLNTIHPSHLHHHFRYGGPDSVKLPPLAETFSVIKSLYFQISPMVWGEEDVSYRLPYFDEVTSKNALKA